MATDARPGTQPYTLYAAQGRVYARNVRQSLIDLGPLAKGDNGWAYLLEGNQLSADGFDSAEAALRHLASRLHFLWLDGQFTAQHDARQEADLSDAVQLDIELDELGPNTPITDATV